ncbi:MAG: hypothetical protein A3I02_03300 [Betaproteobacteria bacterium RIFCSPLOWO2_02_FULL_67_26]|nr:MAG: hypothetical protein A3I02_03300 [Betaproteobacteria bacterium RIFCSPLOWO2_02_FULL_67_26]
MRPDDDSGAALRALPAGLARRCYALVYEALLLGALLLTGALPFVILAHGADHAGARPVFQLYLVALVAVYFVWQWRRGGQTLAMKTWRLRLVTRDGTGLTWGRAITRFLFVLPGTLLLGAGFLWALVDRDGLFLHDRLAGTKIIFVPATTSSRPRRPGTSRWA